MNTSLTNAVPDVKDAEAIGPVQRIAALRSRLQL